ncbi:glycoside hydrolase family 127 protein, partial [Paenibacillus sepulcri]|nr:glycoside hydrolase family 127 protein [Paenibacillus sepulcri]
GHFHTRLGTLDAIARFGVFTGDAALISWVNKSYEWALTKCTAFGWTPGDLKEQAYEHETCSLVDLIATGITLAKSGYTKYWGTVERFIRNHLTESQLLEMDWVKEADDRSGDVPGWLTHHNIAQRTRGAFAGYSAPNDFCCDVSHGRGHTNDLQICCLGSGTRGLFMGWSNTITEKNGAISVNFLLNRGSVWLDVDSYLPHEGKVVLHIHRDLPRLQIRIPEWAGYAKVSYVREREGSEAVSGRGSDSSMWVNEHFLTLGAAQAGETITVTFPLSSRTTIENAIGQTFETHWRGDDVVNISPKGTQHPFYSGRKVYDEAPLK